ncbi:MAG: hypothetical protein IT306_24125 [Chloroflexi bacterium]|nr:hypothetical protein [Chloroflexota bacterium]
MLLLRMLGLLLSSLILVAPLILTGASTSYAAEDPCPEPNDSFQAACFLGQDSDAFGYLSASNDVDAYRIEVLDFNATVRLRLVERPGPYQIELADWNGKIVVGSGTGGVIETKLTSPGAYYVFVHAANGPASASAPYRLSRELQYPGAKAPDILYSNELRFGAEPEEKVDTGAEYSSEGSKFTIRMLEAGTPDTTKFAASLWGPELSDFTLTVDTRMQSQGLAGYHLSFRITENSGYVLLVTAARAIALGRTGSGDAQILAHAMPKSLDLEGGVNRTTIRCVGDEIRVWINGEQVIRVRDDGPRAGRFGFGAATAGPPPTITFDNILATTPGGP